MVHDNGKCTKCNSRDIEYIPGYYTDGHGTDLGLWNPEMYKCQNCGNETYWTTDVHVIPKFKIGEKVRLNALAHTKEHVEFLKDSERNGKVIKITPPITMPIVDKMGIDGISFFYITDNPIGGHHGTWEKYLESDE